MKLCTGQPPRDAMLDSVSGTFPVPNTNHLMILLSGLYPRLFQSQTPTASWYYCQVCIPDFSSPKHFSELWKCGSSPSKCRSVSLDPKPLPEQHKHRPTPPAKALVGSTLSTGQLPHNAPVVTPRWPLWMLELYKPVVLADVFVSYFLNINPVKTLVWPIKIQVNTLIMRLSGSSVHILSNMSKHFPELQIYRSTPS